MKLAEALSIRLNELMVARNLSGYGLYKLSGVSQATISDLKNKVNNGVNVRIIYELTQGLGIDIATFFDSPLFRGDNIVD